MKIDKALSAEIKRGLERNKAIQVVRGWLRRLTKVEGSGDGQLACWQWADEQLGDINQNFTTRLEERTKDAYERLEVLKQRIDSLEEVRRTAVLA